MEYKKAEISDFDKAFQFIENLWDYNTYDYEETKKVYTEVINDENAFAFFVVDKGEYIGFCHGVFFNTFWMCGQTCYISGIITKEEYRGKGYGIKIMDHAKTIAKEKGCKALILDSGMSRTKAHSFYEKYGFEKDCYSFELML